MVLDGVPEPIIDDHEPITRAGFAAVYRNAQAVRRGQVVFDSYRDCVIANDAFNDPAAQRECSSEANSTATGLP